MKKMLLFALVLFLAGCKKEKDLTPDIGIEEVGIKEFSVPGIPADNISIQNQIVRIKLPAGYKGDFIKPVVKATAHFNVAAHITNGFNFQGKDVEFLLESVKYEPRLYKVVVITQDPIQVLSNQISYEVSIDPGARIRVPLLLPGTATTVDNLGQSYWAPAVTVKNKADGTPLSHYWTGKEIDSTGTYLTIDFSVEVNAGEYEATIQWGDKSAVLPPLLLKHGTMFINNGLHSITPAASELVLTGYNIPSGSTYEAILENDFIQARKLTFVRNDYTKLSSALPKDLPTGSYRATILVNGKPLTYETNPLQGYANFHYRKSEEQPFVNIISQPSLKKDRSQYFSYYESTNVISRNEDLLINVGWFGGYVENDLKLVNRDTKAEFILKNPGVSLSVGDGLQVFSAYKIPNEIPNGQYEAYIVLDNADKLTSEKYPRILTIK